VTRTEDILSAIDATIGDYAVSQDAVRYLPEPPEQPEPSNLEVGRVAGGDGFAIIGPPGLDYEAMSAAAEGMAEAVTE
jgi:hypothetical protein